MLTYLLQSKVKVSFFIVKGPLEPAPLQGADRAHPEVTQGYTALTGACPGPRAASHTDRIASFVLTQTRGGHRFTLPPCRQGSRRVQLAPDTGGARVWTGLWGMTGTLEHHSILKICGS